MKLVMNNAKLLTNCVTAIVDLIKDAEFIIDEYGMSLKAIDAGQIAMTILKIPRDAFESFINEGSQKIGINLPSLNSILKRAKNNDKLILELTENKKLNIILDGDNKRIFSINLIDIVATDLPNPNIDFDAIINMNSSVLTDGVKDASLFANYLIFSVKDNTLIISAKGPKGEINNKTSLDSTLIKDKEIKGECKAMFSIEYLQSLLKGTTGDTDTKIFLKSNSPIKLKYNIEQAVLEFFLAPRDID